MKEVNRSETKENSCRSECVKKKLIKRSYLWVKSERIEFHPHSSFHTHKRMNWERFAPFFRKWHNFYSDMLGYRVKKMRNSKFMHLSTLNYCGSRLRPSTFRLK